MAAGTVLLQAGKDTVLRPVCYSSPEFKTHQTHHNTIEEAATLLMALKKFVVYLSCTPYEVEDFCDYKSLQFVMKMEHKNQRLTRRYLVL